ncbi:bis(5'-nucleosyl)-tetraphosphatase PrpE [Geobacillus stearothermophilus]|uniref:bis(5'-nucleosyl)-tetraphosphatase PrpE n=1 Tax=Geobacillus stearothermophilus TaxID=1422 RepID=UPI002E1EE2A5|nr:bis(5'-nucleosyl)-tetraphosphatase PrpE [Geobacillus stearothermophilus]MED4299507.1 bis(5'-nucleosyl)-tetraphosphatase PrpE [Geobacillus stearothermophilus]
MQVDIIGDIHGCFREFAALTETLGYHWDEGVPIHPDGRKLGFVGDLTDRGPESLNMIEIVSALVERKLAYYVPGNHCNKLYRFFLGRNVQIAHGLETTVSEYRTLPPSEQEMIRRKFIRLYEQAPLYAVLDEGRLVIAHAGIRHDYIGRTDQKVKTFVLYGDITGETNPDGTPVRRDWTKRYHGSAWVVYGHTPVKTPRFVGRTVNIDTGCVFGGALTALRYPEMETVSVPSSMPYVPEKFRSFP